MEIVLILILFCILLLMCAVCTLGGFFVGKNSDFPVLKRKALKEELSEEQRRRIERRMHENNNFLNYNGTEQEDFNA